MTRLDEIMRLAEEATPGPWSNKELAGMEDNILSADGETWVVFSDEHQTMKQEDSDFITALNPQTVRQMVELLKMQYEALTIAHDDVRSGVLWVGRGIAKVSEALAAYERFNGE